MDKTRKKNIKRIVAFACMIAVVLLLAAMPLIARQDPAADGPQASILSGTAVAGSINKSLIGGGTLAEDDAVAVTVPSAVKLTEFLVSNGDTVTAGTAIASVDRVTVMTAITQVQETLEYLSKQIEKASATVSEENVTTLVGGTVKILYAEEGESVQSIMLEHGALAVLSLDGLMAVDLETESTLSVGTAVAVTLSDGTAVTGKIVKNLAGSMTVTVEDNAYAVGEAVQITADDGTSIGSGELYIYSPWNATAYAGTVDAVKVSTGDTLNAGTTLMVLRDVGYSATYRQLIGQRQEYEGLMAELVQMYQTETVTAPCDGVVSGVDENSTQLLAAGTQDYSISLLSNTGSTGDQSGQYPSTENGFGGMGGMMEQEPAFELYDLTVTQIGAVTPQNTMTLDITVDELDVTALQVGMTAQVRIDALGGEKYTATITQIGNTGTNNGGNSKYTVELTMDRSGDMLSGMNATAAVVLSTASDVLTIPADALVEVGNQTIVYTGYDEKNETLLDPVTVKVGGSDGKTVEILEGLTSGQTYYYAYYDTLEVSFTPDFGGGGFFGR